MPPPLIAAAPVLTSALTVASTAVSIAGTLAAARARQQAANYNALAFQQQAQQERAIAGENESDFRRDQRQILARQRALQGATGLAAAGTPLLLEEATVAEIERGASRIREGGARRATALETRAELERLRGRQARTAGRLGAGTTLLTGFRDFVG